MDAYEMIITRRSIRKYRPDPIPDELVLKLLEAGASAPSAGNEQPWHFVVITDRNLIREVPSFHPYSKMLVEAPLAILVCADPSLEKYSGFWIQDVSAATENILLAAHALGLGAVWLGIHPVEERVKGMRKLLSIPENIIPFSLLAIGYPSEKKEASNRLDMSRVHRNKWRGK